MTATPRPQHPSDRELVPRALVRAMFALTMSILLIVTLARFFDHPLSATPPEEPIEVTRDLVLDGDMSGAARISLPDGTLLADLSPEEGGFISGVWRVLQRERSKHGAPLAAPVTLTRSVTGRLTLIDPETGWRADLMGFGQDNARAFARLLD